MTEPRGRALAPHDVAGEASGCPSGHRCALPRPSSELAEALALAMADAEGNREAQERAIGNHYDALGYGALAKAAVVELERLGVLSGTPTADAAARAAEEPRADLPAIPGRGVTTA